MNHTVYIGLGSNIGNREEYLQEAVQLLSAHSEINATNCSSIYETEPIGYEEQSAFLNMVIECKTSLDPSALLEVTQGIERQCGRKRSIRWGPRTIDLDILLYDQENMKMECLTIPHARMWERAFVLIPLQELNSSVQSPSGRSIKAILEGLNDKEGVRLWKERAGVREFGHSES